MGLDGEPRQVNSTLRLVRSCPGGGVLRSSMLEWSCVLVNSAELRTMYRRESLQWIQLALPACSTAATRVVRGVSDMPLSAAYRRIWWGATSSASVREPRTSLSCGFAPGRDT